MKYYVGTENEKEKCKEYKTLGSAVKAAEKSENLMVWDEEGNMVKKTGEEEPETTMEIQEKKTIKPQGRMAITVVCEGTLNIRKSPSWENGNECGRASKGQKYYVKTIHEVDGKKMVETVDGLYLSGQSEHVQFEQI